MDHLSKLVLAGALTVALSGCEVRYIEPVISPPAAAASSPNQITILLNLGYCRRKAVDRLDDGVTNPEIVAKAVEAECVEETVAVEKLMMEGANFPKRVNIWREVMQGSKSGALKDVLESRAAKKK